MIEAKDFYHKLKEQDVDYFTGVPDSLLKEFCAYISANLPPGKHIIAANEGNAVALAAGYHLATGKIALVYMQNSGLGNAVNPLLSLTDKTVYGIPCLLLIGWRGEPGVKDEPQHLKQGEVTMALLEAMGIPYAVLPETINEAEEALKKAFAVMSQKDQAYALLVRKGTFAKAAADRKEEVQSDYPLREKVIEFVVGRLSPKDVLVATTGKTSRELFEVREKMGIGQGADFLTVGSMGHASQIALSLALQKKDRRVICLDGDGALIMHMGALAVIGQTAPGNLKHIVLNNGAHESVGGQPTAAFSADLPGVAESCGYKQILRAKSLKELEMIWPEFTDSAGPGFLEVRVAKGSRSDLGRPTISPMENKNIFMEKMGK